MSEPVRLGQIRLAETADLESIGELTVQAYVDGGFVAPTHDYVSHLRDAQTRHHQAELWIVEVDGSLAGSVTFCPPGSPLREVAADHEGEFRMLAVDPAAQRQGLANLLVRHCFDRCRALGLAQLAICSLPQMRAAHALYEHFGFVRDEGLDWSPVDGVELWGFRSSVPA